ncbi:hypothetical protein SAMN02910265_01324 [Ruminococcus flavefaciens]|uniref:Uncharacterized protein n=2 Tax=Ruminococcus flavefaciens TaxID=1265 RepID=A0A1H6J6F2_RUMFL|nr:hypothetical protein [Ruminococcus flavefaciens]SEH54525.1 hypothetical protein SAMN02910265_01324 [Ruminococcus flavefaciens]
MLGYVKKSKVSSANSAANSLLKAINTSLVEVDEETQDAGSITKIECAGGNATTVTITGNSYSGTTFKTKVDQYMEKAKNKAWKAQCKGGVCIAAAICVDSTYTGTSPAGVVTVDNYSTYSGSGKLDNALAAAVLKAS